MLCLVDGEVDVTETEGFGRGVAGRVKVFGGPEHPIEANDAEIDDVAVGLSFGWVFGVQHFREVAQDGEVCGVGPRAWVVLSFHRAKESRE